MTHHLPTHVPQFGNWDESNEVPFTMVFDNVRAGRGTSKIVNPNNPVENHISFGSSVQQQSGKDDGPPKVSKIDQEQSRGSYEKQEQPHEVSVGGLRTGAESLSHQVYQSQLGNRVGSPHLERKSPVEPGTTIAPGTPGRSRLYPSLNMPDRSPALPQFGTWENDPSAGERFTTIFNEALNVKKSGGPVRIPPSRSDSPAKTDTDTLKGQGQKIFSSRGCCCIC